MSYHSEVKIKQSGDRQGYDDCRELIKGITPQNIAPKDIYKRIKKSLFNMENKEKYNLEEYVDYVVKGYCDFEDEGGEYINLEDVSYKGLDYLYVKAKDGEKPAVYCCEKDDTGGHFALFDTLEKPLQEIIIEQISKKANK